MQYRLRYYQQQASNSAVSALRSGKGRNGIIVLPTGCHSKGTLIKMYDGSDRCVEDIRIGDVLVGDDDTPRNVLQLHRGVERMWVISPMSFGKAFKVNECHILHLRNRLNGDITDISIKELILKPFDYIVNQQLISDNGYTSFTLRVLTADSYFGFTLDGNNLYKDSQGFVHHNSGKSLVIADIASRLDSNLLVFQPSKEILEQNYAKLRSYGITDCSIYSASCGVKEIRRITFATIGSVMNHMDFFRHFKYVLIDECHLCNAQKGMYKDFIESESRVVIGLTATPYRLYPGGLDYGAMLKFITRTRPRIFKDVLYCCQVKELLEKGYLAKLQYFDLTKLDMTRVKENSTGADYDDNSLKDEYSRSNFYEQLVSTVHRVMKPKSGVPRKGILVFTKFVQEALMLKIDIPQCEVVSGDTPKKQREEILEKFKNGKIKVLANCGVLTTGFDYPELDTVVMARPTKSLSLWYQIVGRAIRPFEHKDGWIIDLCGNLRRFGKVEDLTVEEPQKDKWCVTSNGKQLTNVFLN